ncbi:alpha/beta fold hydrolase [Ramlibacter rhizophilus]|uniref:Alpha/beta fold hydrolase n=1 Tax=Ramlibacter rhizophilus TaxID=1781167 RepID=A0A4Z0BS88_9BURK|nr:alpha/beta fold hydrolase [Ramlibacter rhizophilus]TFZ01128.1 alpha/beta fold hydrolase [Ramlibacter rhizophilus]
MKARLVLLPGLAGDATMWRDQLLGLAPWHPEVSDVHMREDSIAAMAALLLQEHEGPLTLCGASMGGMIALEAARQAPERVRGLALLGTTARPETPDMRSLREAAIELFEQGRMEEVIEPNLHFAFHPDHARDPALVGRYLGFVYRAGAQQLARQNRAVTLRPDARPHLPALACPVLVMCGEDDALTPLECSREIHAAVPGAVLHTVPCCGHMLTMEQPARVNAALADWLRATER